MGRALVSWAGSAAALSRSLGCRFGWVEAVAGQGVVRVRAGDVRGCIGSVADQSASSPPRHLKVWRRPDDDPRKVATVAYWATLTSCTDVCRFVCLANYFLKFV